MIGRTRIGAILALASIAPGASASASAPPAAAVPPELQALEQKMLALQLTSERFSGTISFAARPKVTGPLGGFNHVFGHAGAIASPLITAAGEVSFVAPQQASFTVGFLGITISARLVAGTLYVREPFIARLDGGRPWVQEGHKSLAQALGSEPPGASGSSADPAAGFKRLTEVVSRARSIVALGPATVDGQAVSRFKLTIPLAALSKPGHSRAARARGRRQRKLLAPMLRLELFLAEDGLPVRTSLVIRARHGKGEVIEQSDITAIDMPVEVQAPPAAETIARAQLERLMRKRTRAHRRAHHHVRAVRA
jgi:hypothetical protein